jgi:hypothetical protein
VRGWALDLFGARQAVKRKPGAVSVQRANARRNPACV